MVNYLDVTLNLSDASYKPFHKPNSEINYIHIESTHPPSIINNYLYLLSHVYPNYHLTKMYSYKQLPPIKKHQNEVDTIVVELGSRLTEMPSISYINTYIYHIYIYIYIYIHIYIYIYIYIIYILKTHLLRKTFRFFYRSFVSIIKI